MNRDERESRRDSFLGDADDYAAARPGYPTALLETALELGGVAPGAPLLEVGCGTGEATEWFARRGFPVVALDRSADMARLAADRLAAFSSVEVRCQDFELDPPQGQFAGLISATAYHWLDPETRVERCAESLQVGGALILLWHTHPMPYKGYFERSQSIYRRIMPGWTPPSTPSKSEQRIAAVLDELGEAGLFQDLERRSVEWSRTYSRDLYLRLLSTYSDHRSLSSGALDELLAEVGALIDREFSGVVERPYCTELIVGRRSP